MVSTIRLEDCVLSILRSEPHATARSLADRLGANRFTVEACLSRLCRRRDVAKTWAFGLFGAYPIYRIFDEPHAACG